MPRRLYAAHLHAIAGALHNIFREGTYADREIARVLKADKRRGSKDRAFIAEHTYDIVRYYRLYAHLAGKEPTKPEEWWRLIGVHLILNDYELPPWREFADLDADQLRTAYAATTCDPALKESVPDWLYSLGTEQLGEQWDLTLTALNEPAPVVLRANRLKTDPEQLATVLAAEQIETEPIGEDALRVTQRRNLFRTQAFQNGLFELQDYSSQQVAPALEVEAGQTVIDACAGAGGKSLHLAALMDNRGKLLSLDLHAWKLEALKKRARRNGVNNLETRPITSTKVTKRLHERADRLLLDVPCSGLGVLRRNPDAKWKLSPDFLDRVVKEQQDILTRYSRMVKPGGKMVYATCSLLPRENGEQLARFLASEAGAEWTLEHEHTYLPQVEGYDGFYVSRLVRQRP